MAQSSPPVVEMLDPPAGGSARWGVFALVGGIGFILSLMVAGLVLIPRFQASRPLNALQRSDADRVSVDDLYLDLTLVTPQFFESRNLGQYLGDRNPESVLPVLVGLNTHTGSIAHMHHLQGSHGNFQLRGPEGKTYPALTEPIVLTSHHNAYMLLFPARDHYGKRFLDMSEGTLIIVAHHIGKAHERTFSWNLPLPAETSTGGVVGTLMLGVALLGALLVVLSPCAIELTLYYLSIITASVTEGQRAAFRAGGIRALGAGRRRILLNLASFVAGFTALYSFSGATVGLVGEGVRSPLGEYSSLIQYIGGGIILFFAARVLGIDRLVLRLLRRAPQPATAAAVAPSAGRWSRALRAPGQVLLHLRNRAEARVAAGETMRARDSFLVGIGLSSSCLTCMGGAVLYPLMVYAGITSWYSGLITLGLYSLGIAVPMVLIALGFFRIQLTLGRRLGVTRALRTVSGVMLATIGTLILTGHERAITDVAFNLIAEVVRWSA